MQKQQLSSGNAAHDAWLTFLARHQRVSGFLSLLGSFVGFFLNGHAIVALVQWMVRVAGRVAESALLLATLWVTINNVAPLLMIWIFPTKIIDLLNYLSLVAFSLLPELIVAAAIKITIEHWQMLSRKPSWRNPAWIWATLYTIPTSTFLFMTVTTLASFVQIEATSANPVQATGAALTARFLAGWGYSLIEILWTSVGKKSYVAIFDTFRATVATLEKELSMLKSTEQGLRDALQRATDDREKQATVATQLQSDKATIATELQTARATIATLQQEKATLEGERDGLREELASVQEALRAAKARIARREQTRAVALATPTSLATKRHDSPHPMATNGYDSPHPMATNGHDSPHPMATNGHGSPRPMATDNQNETGYVARDDGQTMAIANSRGATIIATGSHRDRIKEAMLQAMTNGEELTYGAIAAAAGAGYSTVKKYVREIREEIAQEMTSNHNVVVSQESGTGD